MEKRAFPVQLLDAAWRPRGLDTTRLLKLDAAWRLGPRPALLAALHRSPVGQALAERALRNPPPTTVEAGPFLPTSGHPPPPPGAMQPAHVARVLACAARPPPTEWHGGHDPATPALSLDPFAAGDIRPVWERNRWAELPLLAQAARLDPGGGHFARAESLLSDWRRANPPFHGPNWMCGQEAALRALHFALALALLDGDRAPTPAARGLLALHARRIAATPAYAAAQDNNHAISEPAGLLACGLLLGDAGMAGRSAARLSNRVRRLVAPCGAFAQLSAGYGRLLLDVLAVTAWLCRRFGVAGSGAHGFGTADLGLPSLGVGGVGRIAGRSGRSGDPAGPLETLRLDTAEAGAAATRPRPAIDAAGLGDPGLNAPGFGAPGLDREAQALAAAAAVWLHRLTDPATGAGPRLGHEDGSAFADLSLAGPADARPSLERAARLFAGRSAGHADDPGCAWLGLPSGPPLPAPPAEWTSRGLRGWTGEGGARVFLRTGPLRFRPGHADLLHLDLWDGPRNLLRDGGTGAYNPPPGRAWWHTHLTGTAAHNTVEFDGADQMPRVSRFLFARWPDTGWLRDGAWMRDHRGNRHERRVRQEGRTWLVEDRVSGGFAGIALRWRLAPGEWRAAPDAVGTATFALDGTLHSAHGSARVSMTADAPLSVALESGWESPAYSEVRPAPVLVARAAAPVSRLLTRIELPPRAC